MNLLLSVSENILSYVSGFGIVQGILLSLLIYFHHKSNRSVNIFLALYIFFMSVIMTMPFIIRLVSWQHSFFQQPIPLLTGPFLYLYLKSFNEKISFRMAWPHFVIFVLFFFPVYFNISVFAKKYPDAKEIPSELLHYPATIALNYLKMGQSIFYFFLCRRILSSYQRSMNNSTVTNRINIRWARVLANGFLLVVFSAVILFGLMIRFPQYFNTLLLINMVIATVYIYITAFKGIIQPAAWQLEDEADNQPVKINKKNIPEIIFSKNRSLSIKKEKPVMADDKMDEIVSRIIVLMEKDKLYQETELTLQDLSDKLKVPAYQVSLAINEGMNKNFNDLVNSYRVSEAKQLLLNPGNRNYTILSVGFEAGFNSKTTFNTVFKKFTGLTPTDYRDKQRMAAVA